MKVNAGAKTIYRMKCFNSKGELKWDEIFGNMVVTSGLNKLLDATFKTGTALPAWYVGLKGTGTVVAGDTMLSHLGWTELTFYSNSTRPTFSPGAIAGGIVDNSASPAVFNINDDGNVYGCFLANDNTIGGATGILYGAGNFDVPRAVIGGDMLEVIITIYQTSV